MKWESPRVDFKYKIGHVGVGCRESSRERSAWGEGSRRSSPGSVWGSVNARNIPRAIFSSAFWRVILLQTDPSMRILTKNSSLGVNPVSRPPAQTKDPFQVGFNPD